MKHKFVANAAKLKKRPSLQSGSNVANRVQSGLNTPVKPFFLFLKEHNLLPLSPLLLFHNHHHTPFLISVCPILCSTFIILYISPFYL